jgi:hypothetical protein
MSTTTQSTDKTIKDSLWEHISSGLHEEKVIYREGFAGLVRLEGIRVTDGGFGATAVPIAQIETEGCYHMPREPWVFSAPWEVIWEQRGRFGARYAGWSFWPAANLVRSFEYLLLRQGDHEGALELIDLR